MKKTYMPLTILLVLALTGNPASYASTDGPIKKLGRGLMNGFTGWLEIPATIQKSYEEDHSMFAGFFYGFPIGIVKAALRSGAGVYEAVTFPFPIPEDYDPVITPESVFERWDIDKQEDDVYY